MFVQPKQANVEFGTIIAIDTTKYTVDVKGQGSMIYQNLPIPFIAGYNGVYGLSLVPSVGQDCIVLPAGQFGYIALPIIPRGNSEDAFNPSVGDKYTRKPNAQPGEFMLSMPKVIFDLLPDGQFFLQLGVEDESTSTFTATDSAFMITTPNMDLVTVGTVMRSSTDQDSYESEYIFDFTNTPSRDSLQYRFGLKERAKLVLAHGKKSIIEGQADENGIDVSAMSLKVSIDQDSSSVTCKQVNGDIDNLELSVDKLTIDANRLQINVGTINILVEQKQVVIQTDSSRIAVGPSDVTIESRSINLTAPTITLRGDTALFGDVNINGDQTVSGAGRYSQTLSLMGRSVALQDELQDSINKLVNYLSGVITVLNTHMHITSVPGLPTATATPTAPFVQPILLTPRGG